MRTVVACALLALAACGGDAFSAGGQPSPGAPDPSASVDPPAMTSAIDPPPPATDAGVTPADPPDAGTTHDAGAPRPEAGEPAEAAPPPADPPDAGAPDAHPEASSCVALPATICIEQSPASWCSHGYAFHCTGAAASTSLCTPASSSGDYCCPSDLICP